MKKYLMGGIAAVAICAAFTSCSKSNDIYEGPQQPIAEKTQVEKYQDAFIKEFGQIAKNQNWGFVDQSTGKASTRGWNKNINQYGTSDCPVIIPANVNHDPGMEEDLVTAYFRNLPEGIQNNVQLDWTDYFVFQVHKGTDSYKAKNNGDLTGSQQMDHLVVRFGDASVAPGKDNAAWDHVQDFNNGNNTNSATTEGRSYQPNHRVIGGTLMVNSGTKEFAYFNSTDSKYHNEYVIIAGADIHPSLAGYYYVGFDFFANGTNPNQQVDRNWKFDDWIVRISPADFVGSQRIFVEDLITSDLNNIDPSDWDFNDAVFDVFVKYDQYNMNSNYAVITLRAAGGTLPLTIAGKEVHQLFGVAQDKMVNTGYASGAEVAPVMFRLTGSQVTSGNAKDIPVIVTAKDGKQYTLTAEPGQPTQKIAAPIANHVKWLKERTHIKEGYSTFMQWIDNPELTWYNPANDANLYQKWY